MKHPSPLSSSDRVYQPSEIASVGHTPAHVPQLTQSSEITYAIVYTSINKIQKYSCCVYCKTQPQGYSRQTVNNICAICNTVS